jgi:hypothetical protein
LDDLLENTNSYVATANDPYLFLVRGRQLQPQQIHIVVAPRRLLEEPYCLNLNLTHWRDKLFHFKEIDIHLNDYLIHVQETGQWYSTNCMSGSTCVNLAFMDPLGTGFALHGLSIIVDGVKKISGLADRKATMENLEFFEKKWESFLTSKPAGDPVPTSGSKDHDDTASKTNGDDCAATSLLSGLRLDT